MYPILLAYIMGNAIEIWEIYSMFVLGDYMNVPVLHKSWPLWSNVSIRSWKDGAVRLDGTELSNSYDSACDIQ